MIQLCQTEYCDYFLAHLDTDRKTRLSFKVETFVHYRNYRELTEKVSDLCVKFEVIQEFISKKDFVRSFPEYLI